MWWLDQKKMALFWENHQTFLWWITCNRDALLWNTLQLCSNCIALHVRDSSLKMDTFQRLLSASKANTGPLVIKWPALVTLCLTFQLVCHHPDSCFSSERGFVVVLAVKYYKSSITLPLAHCTRIDAALEQVSPLLQGEYRCVIFSKGARNWLQYSYCVEITMIRCVKLRHMKAFLETCKKKTVVLYPTWFVFPFPFSWALRSYCFVCLLSVSFFLMLRPGLKGIMCLCLYFSIPFLKRYLLSSPSVSPPSYRIHPTALKGSHCGEGSGRATCQDCRATGAKSVSRQIKDF